MRHDTSPRPRHAPGGPTVCLIPARGGSRRLPGKNLRDFCGKPVLNRSIEAALDAGCFDRVVVSTDDAGIADVARRAGAHVPFMRPAALAEDRVPTLAVVRHALDHLAAEDAAPGALCCLYAVAPFVRPEDLLRARDALGEADFVMPVTRYTFPIQRAVRIDAAGHLRLIGSEDPMMPRSTDREEALHDAGQYYWGITSAWRSDTPFLDQHVAPVEMPGWRVPAIGTSEEWARAEALFRAFGR